MRGPAFERLLAVLVLISLYGCLLGPNYERPKTEVPATFRFSMEETAETANTVWWEQFQDPVLNELIAAALAERLDVKIAAARVEEFRGQFVTTRSGLFPQVGANFDASRQRASQSGAVPLPAGVGAVYNQVDASVSASWRSPAPSARTR